MGDFMYYINNFFIYSILGYLYESVIYLFQDGESGILYGFWTPVYGIGVVIIFFFYKYFSKKGYKKKNILFFEFLVGFFLLSFLELVGGILLENLFGVVFWNYEGLAFNINKYIALETAVVWGLASILCVKFLKPLTDKLEEKIPKWITWIFMILFMIDGFFTLFTKSVLAIF